MPVVATFAADFSDFNTQVKKAEGQLHEFETAGYAAGKAITDISGATDKSTPKVGKFQQAFSEFDAVLAAAGIKIGPAIKAIDEIGAAMEKTAGSLGLLAKGGLILGTFTAAFETTRGVVKTFFPELDNAIARNVSSWMGWGDVAEQTAGAVADAIALAQTRTTTAVTTMSQAVAVNNQWLADHKKHAEDAAKADKEWREATERLMIAGQSWQAVLRRIPDDIEKAAIAKLRLGAAAEDVRISFKLTESQIAALQSALKAEEEQLKATEKAHKETAAEIAKYWDGVGAIVDQVFGIDKLQAATKWVDAIDAMGGSVNHLRTAELEQLQQAMLDGIDALARSGQLTSQQSSEFTKLAIAANVALAALKPVVTVTEDLVKAQWEYVTALDEEARAQAAAAGEAKKKTEAQDSALANRPIGGGLFPNAIVGQNGVAYDQYGRPVVPGGAMSGLPIVNVNITQPLGTPDAIARAIGSAMTSTYRSGGNRLPV